VRPNLFSPVSHAEVAMRIVITAICLMFSCGFAIAQAGSKCEHDDRALTT
jgi:hypothetical protein